MPRRGRDARARRLRRHPRRRVGARPADLRTSGRSRSSSGLRARSSRRPTTLGTTPCSGLRRRASPCRTDERRPRAGICATTTPASAAASPACRRLAASAAAPRAARRLRDGSPTRFGTSTSFGLQFAVLAGPWPCEVERAASCVAVAVVELQLAVAADDRRRRREYGTEATGTCSGASCRYGSALLHEALPDQRREGAAGDGVAVELGQHRPQLVRVADPDRRRRAAACSRRTRRRRSSRSSRSCRRRGRPSASCACLPVPVA